MPRNPFIVIRSIGYYNRNEFILVPGPNIPVHESDMGGLGLEEWEKRPSEQLNNINETKEKKTDWNPDRTVGCTALFNC